MAITEADRIRMGTPAPELLQAIEIDPFPDLSGGKTDATIIDDIRPNRASHLAKLRHLYPVPSPIPDQVTETEHFVKARDGHDIRIRIYVPVSRPKAGSPLLVMFHEGGWCMGDLTDEDQNCRLFSRDFSGVAVNVEYRLAPEYKFPVGLNDCWDVIKWCTKTASSTSLDLPADLQRGFIVGGASAGGNLSAVLCQMARDEQLQPPLTGQYLCVPALGWGEVLPEKWKDEYRSREEATQDPVLKMAGNNDRLMNVIGAELSNPRFSPLIHPNLRDLPPAFFQIGGLDPLRDEGLLYERLLRERNDTPTRLNVYDGFGHMFWTNWPKMARSREFVEDTGKGFAWLLEAGRDKKS